APTAEAALQTAAPVYSAYNTCARSPAASPDTPQRGRTAASSRPAAAAVPLVSRAPPASTRPRPSHTHRVAPRVLLVRVRLRGHGARPPHEVGDHGAPVAPQDRHFLVEPLPLAPIDPCGEVGKKQGEGIARAGAIEAFEERVVTASHGADCRCFYAGSPSSSA